MVVHFLNVLFRILLSSFDKIVGWGNPNFSAQIVQWNCHRGTELFGALFLLFYFFIFIFFCNVC